MENPYEHQFYQEEQRQRLLKKTQLDHVSKTCQKTLPLHVYLFHDLMINSREMITRINFPQDDRKSNVMIIAYDNQIKILCHPVLLSTDNIQLIKDSVDVSSGYQLTFNGEQLANEIKTRRVDGLSDYLGPIEIHQLN